MRYWTMACLCGMTALAQAQTFDLNARYPVGSVFEARETVEVRVRIISGAAKPPDGDIRRLDRCTTRYRVLEEAQGFPTRQEATVLSGRSVIEEPDSEPSRRDCPLKGQQVLVTASPDGGREYARADGAQTDQKEAAEWCDHLPVTLTMGLDLSAAQVGAEWQLPPETARRALNLSEGGTASVSLKFVEVVIEGGHQTARISFAVSIQEGAPQGAQPPLKTEYSGDYFLDLETHLPRFLTARGTAHLVLAKRGDAGADLVLDGPVSMVVFYDPVIQLAPVQ